MTFDGLIYSILISLYNRLKNGETADEEFTREKFESMKPGEKIPQGYWDEAIRAIARRGYVRGFEYDCETNHIYIGDASKLVLTYDGYEFMKQDKFFNPDEVLAELEEKQNKQ